MPRVKKLDLGMTALDELFMNDKERAENKLPKIFDIPLSEIDDFPDHPYRVLDDEDMQNLMESIRDRGVITPAMVRKKDDGRYEMISGHRRKHASERLGLETLRCEVVEVSRDEAIILMVDSNAQRSEILPCDKRVEKETDRMAERKKVDFLPIKKAIYSNVSDKFDCCTLDTAKAFNDLLVRYFSKKQPTEDIDLQVLRDTVDRIYINKCGTVKIKFINGAEISKEDSYGSDSYSTETKDNN